MSSCTINNGAVGVFMAKNHNCVDGSCKILIISIGKGPGSNWHSITGTCDTDASL